jgi:5-methylcytosine-specific restriction endonuclease McrA
MGTRICSVCKQEKPLTIEYFAANKRISAPPFRNDCRECVKARNRKRYANNQEAAKKGRENAKRQREKLKVAGIYKDKGAEWRKARKAKLGDYYKEYLQNVRRRQATKYGREYRERVIREIKPKTQYEKECLICKTPFVTLIQRQILCGKPACRAEYQRYKACEYHKLHPEMLMFRKHRRDARQREKDNGTVTKEAIKDLYSTAKTCPYCGIKITRQNRSIDHLEPLSGDGYHSVDNIIVCCRSCNTHKLNMPFHKWINKLNQEHKQAAIQIYTRRRGAAIGLLSFGF